MTEVANTAPEAPVNDAPVSTPANPGPPQASPDPEKAAADLYDFQSKIYDKAQQEPAERDESGRFVAKNAPPLDESKVSKATALDAKPTAEVKKSSSPEAKASEQVPATEKPSQPAIESPKSWKAEMKEKFASLPPDVQAYVAERDKEVTAEFSRLGNVVQAVRPLAELVDANRDVFQRYGYEPKDGIARLLHVQRQLERDPVSTIREIAKDYRVDLSQLTGNADPYQIGPDPRDAEMAELRNQLSQLTQYLSGHQQQQVRVREDQNVSLISEFAKDKPDFEELSTEIMANFSVIRQLKPNLSNDRVLAEAYDRAVWGNEKARTSRIERQAKEAEAKRIEEAKKQAAEAQRAVAVNVKSSPKANGSFDLADFQSALFDKIQARA